MAACTQCQRDLVRGERGIEPLPEIDILDRLLVGGAPAVALPVAIQRVMPLRRYWLSVCRSTRHGRFNASRAAIAAISSMRLLVVAARRLSTPFRDRRRSGSRPSRPGRDCRNRRRRCRSTTCGRASFTARQPIIARGCRPSGGSGACANIRAGPSAGPARPAARQASRRAASAESAARRRAPAAGALRTRLADSERALV